MFTCCKKERISKLGITKKRHSESCRSAAWIREEVYNFVIAFRTSMMYAIEGLGRVYNIARCMHVVSNTAELTSANKDEIFTMGGNL